MEDTDVLVGNLVDRHGRAIWRQPVCGAEAPRAPFSSDLGSYDVGRGIAVRPSSKPTLGSSMRALRARHGLTLKEMSARIGLPFSTLSKVEHDRLTLTFDKLQMISERLNISVSELFAEEKRGESTANSRRSVATLANALSVVTPNYDYHYLSPELRQKDMIPILSHVKARSLEEFGDMVRHDGQEFIYVLEGAIVVHTEFYDPVTLMRDQAVYIDSKMGHAYVLERDCKTATVLCVCSTSQEDLLNNAASQSEGIRKRISTAIRPPRLAKAGE